MSSGSWTSRCASSSCSASADPPHAEANRPMCRVCGLAERLGGGSDSQRGSRVADVTRSPDGVAPAFAPPEGSFLVRGDGPYELVSQAGSQVLPSGIEAYDVSPDGRQVLGGRIEQFLEFGRADRILVVLPSNHQDPAVGEQGRGVLVPRSGHRPVRPK
jgi:hypothetical protein